MDINKLIPIFKSKICESVNIEQEGENRFLIFTPFYFEDGDAFSIALKKFGNKWKITDEAHTLMHLSYDMDLKGLSYGNRGKIFSNIISSFGLKEDRGELFIDFEDIENSDNALYTFIHALVKITDLSYLERETVRNIFYEDCEKFLTTTIPAEHLQKDYYIKNKDIEKKYPIDYVINNRAKPIFIVPVLNDDKCMNSTINLLQCEKWGINFEAVAIFEDQEKINRKVLARFSDVCDKQYSNFYGNKDKIIKRLLEYI